MTVAPDSFATIPLLPGQPAKQKNAGYRIVIPECLGDPETKPCANMRIGREIARIQNRYRAAARFRPAAIEL
ncbi:hypothetical protein [Mycobacterium palustre]|uniref:hypothetical protein n=1 Tax=Mycobacterium palustre TaxID=153971 RepID=UPI0011511A1B|nr:hypothetical protein [Mycobacterium palustre]MCV7100611.1 hypothetical protein [Mycobacterium palustre]